MKRIIKYVAAVSAAVFLVLPDVYAQSAIYACGHIRRNRGYAIDNLRSSGYTTAILFNVNVEADGTLTTDYDWGNQRPAEAGGIICRDGKYVFDRYQPDYAADVKSLVAAPTSISRLEICIGGWGNGSYGNIRRLVESEGVGAQSTLYRNFKALKEALPEVVAVNNDQEQDYDLPSATAFHRMLADVGFKTTVAPYMHRDYWRDLVSALNAVPGTCDLVYLQTYGGGAGNNPSDWKVFGDIPMYIGFDCEASGDLRGMETRFRYWRDNDGMQGGFLWNYNSEARDQNEWATAINRIFPTMSVEHPVATFFQDADFGGYAVELPAGSFTQADMALYGIRARDISSLKVTTGYRVTAYTGANFDGQKQAWTTASNYVGGEWNDRICSIVIEHDGESGIVEVDSDGKSGLEVEAAPGTRGISVNGVASGRIRVYGLSGLKVADVAADSSGHTPVCLDSAVPGVYLVSGGGRSARFVLR